MPLAAPLNRALHRGRQVVWMIGDGRSGSSWIAGLLTATCAYRQLFEPFHPREVRKFSDYPLNHFQRPGSCNEALRSKLQDVFEGRINNRRVNQDAGRFLHDGILAKDVFATLLAAWAMENFPRTKLVLTVRNPFAVALSKARKPRWRWTAGPAELVAQDSLVDAHLGPHVDFLSYIEARGDPLLNHIAVWAILHSCFFRDFDARRLHIMIYRRTLKNPSGEMERLLEYLGKPDVVPEFGADLLERPARYSDGSSVAAVRGSGDRNWFDELTADQVKRGNEILAHFGLADLYDNGEPAPEFEGIASAFYRATPAITDPKISRDGVCKKSAPVPEHVHPR